MTNLTAADLQIRGIPAIEKLLDLANNEIPIPLGPGNRAPVVAYGLFMNLAHQAYALMLLREQDADHACAALRRSLIEHTASLLWLADDTEKAVNAINRGLQYTQKKLKEAAHKAGMGQDERTQATLAATLAELLPSAETHLLQHSKLVDAYLGPTLGAIWHAESGYAHPSIHVVRLYVEQNGDDTKLHKRPRLDAAQQTVATCLYALYCGALALNSLTQEPLWEPTLRSIAEDLGLSMELPRRNTT
ncbi:DUF5677 domain-containing protein [Microbispora hainanensis]|uniref:Uncharacterized protein n=1 Tax=Microbispora hainanensis TaxID=568844 RepID=A0A544YNB6_9ACTN|nr:DUF5677 domain-containing protein [Microbispora hainanensis]TQS18062.1 hypothetical protein FLX08_26630 [Microbispora hainanensis]